jgi:hypothetical protein
MTKTKNRAIQLISNVEKPIAELAWEEVNAQETSMSAYIRDLIIANLRETGRLTPEIMEGLL